MAAHFVRVGDIVHDQQAKIKSILGEHVGALRVGSGKTLCLTQSRKVVVRISITNHPKTECGRLPKWRSVFDQGLGGSDVLTPHENTIHSKVMWREYVAPGR